VSGRAVLKGLRLGAGMVVVAVLVLGFMADASPGLSYPTGAPNDLRALAERSWTRFLDAFPAREACIPDLQVVGVRSLGDRAEYRPETAMVLVRIPATAAQLETALVHEFAHHLEFHCPAQRAIRGDFLRAQETAPTRSWFGGRTWDTIPSEQFAEATVEVVLGYRTIHRTLFISPRAVRLIAEWGRNPTT
jgi:hypothetical protein